jgi:hypothetical protein
MSDNVRYITYGENMGGVPANTVIETQVQADGSNRQVIAIGGADAGGVAVVSARLQTPPVGNVLQVQGGVMDVIDGLPVMIDYNQHQVHEGETYYAQHVSLNTNITPYKFGLVVATYAKTIQAPHMVLEVSVYNNAVRVDVLQMARYCFRTSRVPVPKRRAAHQAVANGC